MTTTRRPRLLSVLTSLAAALSLLLAAACSSGTTGSSADHDAGTSAHSDSSRETAEIRLQQISAQLGTVLTDYSTGKKSRAYTLAKSVSNNLYEGTTEGIVSSIDPAVERQIDSLLAATLPAAIQNGEPLSAVSTLIHHAQALAASGLAAIHKSEN